jgi:hypothetical protein
MYAAAATLGGMSLAALLAGVGLIIRAGRVGALAVIVPMGCIAVVAVLAEALARHPVEVARQVPRRWLAWRSRTRTAAAYGFMLGSAILTKLHYPSFYVLIPVFALAPSLSAGVAVGGLYGGARAVGTVASWYTRGRSQGWLALAGPRPHRTVTGRIGLVAAAGLALFVAATGVIVGF